MVCVYVCVRMCVVDVCVVGGGGNRCLKCGRLNGHGARVAWATLQAPKSAAQTCKLKQYTALACGCLLGAC